MSPGHERVNYICHPKGTSFTQERNGEGGGGAGRRGRRESGRAEGLSRGYIQLDVLQTISSLLCPTDRMPICRRSSMVKWSKHLPVTWLLTNRSE